MARNWRLLDTGLRSAAQNIALDRALLESRRANEIPTTLRFFRYTPCALLSLQQSAAHELDLAYCASHNIGIQRRITGGAALYMDTRQLGFALYTDKGELGEADLRSAARQLCHTVATAVSALGCEAQYRRYDEIELAGRAIGGCAAGTDADAVLLSGWLFTQLDYDALAGVLRMPVDHAPAQVRAALAERVGDVAGACGVQPVLARLRQNIAEAVGSGYDAELFEGDLGLTEERRYNSALPQIDTRDWVELVARPLAQAPRAEASARISRGWLRAHVLLDRETQVLKRVWFTGDIAFDPKRVRYDLESELRDLPFPRVVPRLEWFFGSRARFTTDATAADFAAVIARAVGQPLLGVRP